MAARPPRNVFLTGATGFLGIHLVAALQENPHVDVYCLIRAKDEKEGLHRVATQAEKFQIKIDLNRIVPVIGDLSKPDFGLEFQEYKSLAGEIDSIIHNGAAVNLVKPYAAMKVVNVLGTQEVLRFAVTNGFRTTRVKPVHYVSTNGVFGTHTNIMQEVPVPNEWQHLSTGYSQSKWVAEQMCLEARKRGLPVSILRPGNMAPSSCTGIWNPSDFYYILLQACVQLGAMPEHVEWFFDMTPVDFAAKAIAHVAVEAPIKSLGQIMHIQNHHNALTSSELFDMVRQHNPALLSIPIQEWKVLLDDRATQATGSVDEQSLLLKRLQAGFENFVDYLAFEASFETTTASSALHPANIVCPKINEQIIKVYMAHINQS